MGRRLDVLLGRTSKQTARLKSLLGLASTRLGVLRGHRQVRCAQARGDAEQLLRLGAADRALLRAEQVVREQNALDALLMLEGYCGLVVERAALLDDAQARGGECPEEIREAAAGIVYAAARCGDVPELQEVRRILGAKFGREFVSAAAELRSGCRVNAKIVQKLSTKQPSLESRQMVLQEIAAEKGIPVRLHEPHEDDSEHSSRRNRERISRPPQAVEIEEEDISGDSAQRYNDVQAAAQVAFESAASAAAAAKAAMELSRGEPRGPGDRKQAKERGEIGHARNYSSEIEDFPENEANRGNVADSELKQHEQRGRPASVRTKRGF